MIREVELEPFTLVSSKRFDETIAAIDNSVAHPNTEQLSTAIRQASSLGEM